MKERLEKASSRYIEIFSEIDGYHWKLEQEYTVELKFRAFINIFLNAQDGFQTFFVSVSL
jgi:hypothetical protein